MQCSFHEALSIKYMQLLWGTLQCNFHRSIDMLLGGGGGGGINMLWEECQHVWGGGGG